MGDRSALPVLELAGGPVERGQAHGEALREQVQANWERCVEVRSDAGHGTADDQLAVLVDGTGFGTALDRWAPDVAAEIGGLAAGAAIDPRAALALNLLDEADWVLPVTSPERAPGACSSAAIAPPAGDVVIGQTMDLPAQYDGTQVVLRLRGEDDAFVLTFAGSVGLCGFNRHGLGIACNQLSRLRPSRSGLPVAGVMRRALSATDVADAAARIRAVPHASGQHYLLADRDGWMSLECSAGGVAAYRPEGSVVTHTNHALASADAGDEVAELDGFSGGSSPRLAHLRRSLPGDGSAAQLRAVLEDRTTPISKAVSDGADGSFTLGAYVLEASARPRGWWTVGPPHESPWHPVAFDSRT